MEQNFAEWLAEKNLQAVKITELKDSAGKAALLWVECKDFYQKFLVMTEMQTFFYKGGEPRQGIVVWNDRDEGKNCMQFRGYPEVVLQLEADFKRIGSQGFRNEKLNTYEWKAVQADIDAVRVKLCKILDINN